MIAAHRAVRDTPTHSAHIARGSTIFFLGTIPQACLLLMSLNVATCNLGYVKHKKILLASSISQGWCVGWPGVLMQGRYVVYCSVSDVKSFRMFFAAGLLS